MPRCGPSNAAEIALGSFVAQIEAITADMDIAGQLVEVVGYIIERLPHEPQLALLLALDRSNLFSRTMLAPAEIARCRTLLQHTHIDWTALGYDDKAIDELVEFLLRIIQSLVIAPPEPPRSSTELRAYVRRWVGPAVNPTLQLLTKVSRSGNERCHRSTGDRSDQAAEGPLLQAPGLQGLAGLAEPLQRRFPQ